jgi:hypothetical protein
VITLEMLKGACKNPLVNLANLGQKANDVVTDVAITMSDSPLWTAYLEERFAEIAGTSDPEDRHVLLVSFAGEIFAAGQYSNGKIH